MRHPPLTQEVVGADGTVDVVLVDTKSDTHEHHLRAFDDFIIHAKEIGAGEGFEAEVVVVIVAVIVDGEFNAFLVFVDEGMYVLTDERRGEVGAGVDVVEHLVGDGDNVVGGLLVEVGDCDVGGELAIVGVLGGHGGGSFGSELV